MNNRNNNKGSEIRPWIIGSVGLLIIALSILIWYIARGIYWEGFINRLWNLDLERTAQAGDFLGGCLGSIFALVGVFLLFETLKLQRKELSDSKYVFKLQQFDNIFFNLFKIHEEIGSRLTDYLGVKKGKSFFNQEFNTMYTAFNATSRNTKTPYNTFYQQYESQLAPYFRTLYQLFYLISTSDIKEHDKVKYAKIVRAQLTSSELFFLHYNARTPYGKKFRDLIIEFNITKHLSVVDKLEFKKDIPSTLSDVERHSLRIALLDIRKAIRKDVLRDGKTYYHTFLKGKFAVGIKTDSLRSTIEMELTWNPSINPGTYFQDGLGFNQYNEKGLSDLFENFLNDVVSYSNYHLSNPLSVVKVMSTINPVIPPRTTAKIFVTAKRIDGKPLKVI